MKNNLTKGGRGFKIKFVKPADFKEFAGVSNDIFIL